MLSINLEVLEKGDFNFITDYELFKRGNSEAVYVVEVCDNKHTVKTPLGEFRHYLLVLNYVKVMLKPYVGFEGLITIYDPGSHLLLLQSGVANDVLYKVFGVSILIGSTVHEEVDYGEALVLLNTNIASIKSAQELCHSSKTVTYIDGRSEVYGK